jgi:hypothetical protein
MALVVVARGVVAQNAQPRPTTRHPVTARYEVEKKKLEALADSMPADAFEMRIAGNLKSFGEYIGHTVDTNFGVCAGATNRTSPRKDQPVEGVVTAKGELLALAEASFAYCDSVFSSLPIGSMANSDLTFLATHLAQTTALMELHLLMRGYQSPTAEAGRRRPRKP